MDGGAWWAAVHGVTKSQTRLSDFTFPFHFHALEKEMATPSSVLAWRIPGMEEPGRLPSMGLHRVGHDWSNLAHTQGKTHLRQVYASLTAAAAALLQSCPTLCDPIDSSPPGSAVPGILQARTLEWVAISFCNAWKWKVKVKSLSCVQLLATPWTAAHQAPPSMDFPGRSTGVGCHCLLCCFDYLKKMWPEACRNFTLHFRNFTLHFLWEQWFSEVKVAQLCQTLSNPMDCSLPGSFIHGIFQARALEWGAIAFCNMFC